MKQTERNHVLLINRIPLLGILFFGILYLYAATLYPGGSQADVNSTGFDWINNYWCNLMNERAMNGLINPARPFSIFAMLILCGSLAFFFFQFAAYFCNNPTWRKIIKTAGLLSMFFAALMFTRYHDLMTIVSSCFGLFVVIGIIKEIYGSDLLFYKITGLIALILLALNNYVYYTTHFLECLPLLQKVTFLIVLIWILGLNYELRKRIRGASLAPTSTR